MFVLKELELFNSDLLKKPAVLALNKIDTDKDGTLTDSIVDQIQNIPGNKLILLY
jgi:GTPase involved in cell partitioning and DNA repair